MGPFITFEGIEGCGKTTQMRMAADYLRRRQIGLITTEEPGGTPLGRKIREILLNRSSLEICAEAELLLFSAARAQHIKDVILPALQKDCGVLCDRFSDATAAYQGFGRGLATGGSTDELSRLSSGFLKPDLTILFDLPVETGIGRAMDRISRLQGAPAEDRFEREDRAFHQRVREGYLMLAGREPKRFRIIDASGDMSGIHEQVCAHLSALTDAFRKPAGTT